MVKLIHACLLLASTDCFNRWYPLIADADTPETEAICLLIMSPEAASSGVNLNCKVIGMCQVLNLKTDGGEDTFSFVLKKMRLEIHDNKKNIIGSFCGEMKKPNLPFPKTDHA